MYPVQPFIIEVRGPALISILPILSGQAVFPTYLSPKPSSYAVMLRCRALATGFGQNLEIFRSLIDTQWFLFVLFACIASLFKIAGLIRS